LVRVAGWAEWVVGAGGVGGELGAGGVAQRVYTVPPASLGGRGGGREGVGGWDWGF